MEKYPTKNETLPSDSGTAEKKETLRLEWGKDFGQMTWYEAKEKLDKLNKSLKKGEKPWRLPDESEIISQHTDSPSFFHKDENYWSDEFESGQFSEMAKSVYTVSENLAGQVGEAGKDDKGFFRPVR